MTIEVQCDECFQSYKVRDERAGQTLKCKSCGGRIHVPAGENEFEDLNAHYGEPLRPARKKKKPVKAKKKKASRRPINFSPGKIVKKTFGVLAIAVGCLIIGGAVYSLFQGEAANGKKARPIYAFFVASAFLGVGKKWLVDD